MKIILHTLSFILILTSCTTLDVEENLPLIKDLNPVQMETTLDRVNIIADSDSLDIMFTHYYEDILVRSIIKYYNFEGELLFQEVGHVDIRGSGSAQYDMKPLGITFLNKIDNNQLQIINTTQALPGDNLGYLQSIRLRNSGQDYGFTMLKDLAYTELAIAVDLDLELKYGKPIHVFLNDEYYGLHNLRTDNDRVALADLLDTDTSSITIIKMDKSNGNLEYREGDPAIFETLHNAIKNEDVETLKQVLDIGNFMDYIIFEDYIGNQDWPFSNVKAYSVNGSKFRFLLFDLDFAGFRSKNPILPEMEYNKDDISKIYQILRSKDEDFIGQFKNKQEYWYAKFSTNLFNLIVDELASNIENDILFLIQKRGVPSSFLHWNLYLEQIKQDFNRTDHNNRKKYKIQ